MIKAIVDEFMRKTTIPETENRTVRHIMEFLCEEENINRMIAATEMGLPALAGVVDELERRFADSDFPIKTIEKDDKEKKEKHNNATNRRNIGWMIKFIMEKFGYTPCENGQARIGSFSKYFSSAARYEKTGPGEYKMVPSVVKIG